MRLSFVQSTAMQSNTSGAYSCYDNVISWKNKIIAFYNGYAVGNAAGLNSEGWLVPDDNDWNQLTDYIGGTLSPYNQLKSCHQVNSPLNSDCYTIEHPRWNSLKTHFGTDDFGFSVLPGGYRLSTGNYMNKGNFSFWWSFSAYHQSYSHTRGMFCNFGTISWGIEHYTYGYIAASIINPCCYNK